MSLCAPACNTSIIIITRCYYRGYGEARPSPTPFAPRHQSNRTRVLARSRRAPRRMSNHTTVTRFGKDGKNFYHLLRARVYDGSRGAGEPEHCVRFNCSRGVPTHEIKMRLARVIYYANVCYILEYEMHNISQTIIIIRTIN